MDSHYLLALIYHYKKQWKNVLFHGHEYYRLAEEFTINPGAFGQIVHNTINHRWRVHVHVGFALEELHGSDEAEKEFSMAEVLCSDVVEHHKLMARHYFSKSRSKLAEKYFEKALEIRSPDVELLKIGVEIYADMGEKNKEKKLLKQIMDRGDSQEENFFRMGTILLQENSLQEASGFLRNVIATNPRHTGALINLGLVAKRGKKFSEAVSYFKTALEEDPFSVEGLSNLGYTYYQQGDLIGAEKTFERLSKVAPNLVDPFLVLSKIHVEQGNFERAVEVCDALLRLLKLDRGGTLHSLAELGDLYLKIGETLIQTKQMNLAYWAFQTGLLLSKNPPYMFQRILSLYPESVNPQGFLGSMDEKIGFSGGSHR